MNFVSSITLQFKDLFSPGMAQAHASVTGLQNSLNNIAPAGLTTSLEELSSIKINIPAPEIGIPAIPVPETPAIDIPIPNIPQPEIPVPDNPSINIPVPEISQPTIPAPDASRFTAGLNKIQEGLAELSSIKINILAPEIGKPEIPVPDNPNIQIPTPEVPTPEIKPVEVPAPDTSRFTAGLNEIQEGLDKLAENNALNTLATQLSVMSMAVAPIQQSLNNALDKPSQLAATFESSMINIQVITKNSAEQMEVLNREILEIGKTAAAGPRGAANAMNDIAGGVDNAASHLGILRGAVLLAEAGQADLGVSANGLVSIMNAYGLASGDAASAMTNAVNVSDVLTQTVGQGVGSMEQFISAFSQVSGVSASVGVGFDEVGAALAFITTQGPSASESATQLKAALTALLNPNETLAKALQSVGIESGSAMLAEYGLVESLNIVKQSVGGSQDAMAKALGSTMALQGATALLGDGYTDFSAKFGTVLQTSVTAEAAAVQSESYEMKLAKMTAATEALQLQVGDNINGIKGFFADMGTGFLTNVVSPIMSSPVGGFFQGLAAVVGVGGQQLLSLGGGALQAAVQFSTLAANIKNAGGYAKIFHGAMTILGTPFKSIGGLIKGFATHLFSMGAAGATGAAGTTAMGVASGAATAPMGAATVATGGLAVAVNSLLLPILAVIVALAVVGVGAYMLIKHWDTVSAFFVNLWNKVTGAFSAAFNWIRNLLGGVPDWVLAAVAVFMPFIGIPALIIKHWDVVSAFFVNLWNNITGVTASAANWFGGVWNGITGSFVSAWMWVKGIFIGVWDGFKGTVLGFVEWLSPVTDILIAPFKAVGNFIGGIVGNVKGWFGDTVETGKTELARAAESRAQNQTITASVPSAVQTAPAVPPTNPVIDPPVLTTTTSAVSVPAIDIPVFSTADVPTAASVIPPPVSASLPEIQTATTQPSGNALAFEHIEAAQRKGIASSDISFAASSAFDTAGQVAGNFAGDFDSGIVSSVPALSLPDIEEEARVSFADAMPRRETAETKQERTETRNESPRQNVFHIANMNFNADEMRSVFDFVHQLELLTTEAAV